MEKEKVIELKKVGISYNIRGSVLGVKKKKTFWALKNITLDVYKGEVLGVLGRNGAGKSTLLSLLSGIISQNKGTVVQKVSKVSLLSLQTGFIQYLSGRKNIILSGMFLGLRKKELEDKMDEIIEFSELHNFIDQPVSTYSSGMKARLGFATAIHMDPDILLIDETLGVGDRAFKEKSSAYMKNKIKNSETTAILVSHSENLIREVCDRACVISDGEICYEGDVEKAIETHISLMSKKKSKIKK